MSAVDISGVQVDSAHDGIALRKQRYADVSDKTIAEAIERSMRADAVVFSRANEITATVKSGVVTLSGKVDRLRVKNGAERIAKDVIGVQRVRNNIEVQQESGSPSDIKIVPQ